MDWLAAQDYEMARFLLQRGIALVYLIAFVNVKNQFAPLLGEHGLLPARRHLERRSFREAPSLFHWRISDRLVDGVAWSGIVLSAAALAGLTDWLPLWASIPWWLAMWALYLSIVNVGQTFYGFGWESLLLEAGFLAAFLGNATIAPPLLTLWLFRWLLFRVEFGAGLIKMRGDRCWRDLTCLEYHHETQPMPGPTSRWFHLLPRWAHRTEVAANHVAQLAAPFLLFLPQPAAGIGAAVMILTQGYLLVSGNYAWLNLLTLLLGFAAVPDGWWAAVGVVAPETGSGVPDWFSIAVVALAAVVAGLSWWPVRNLMSGGQRMNAAFNRYHLVNTYGAFGSVTKQRRELIIEWSHSEDRSGQWTPYEFKGKPGDPAAIPRQWAPYHLRLDWLMWFVPLSPAYGRGWLDALIEKLLEGDPAVESLLARTPDEPPRWIRARMVDYRFATRSEHRDTDLVWITGPSEVVIHPIGR